MPHDDIVLPRYLAERPVTSCEECDRVLRSYDNVLIVTKHYGDASRQLHFCSERCANENYLERLRGGGM